MTWSYAVHNLAGTKIADLDDYCTAVTNLTEGQGGGKVGANVQVGFLDGERWEPKTQGAANIILSTVIRYTDEDGVVDHEDGKPGHFMENLAALHRLLGQGRRYLYRTAPHAGSQRLLFESVTDPVTGDDKPEYRWVLRSLSGSWQSVTQQTATGNPPSVTTGGNRPIFDPEISLSAAGSFKYTNGEGEEFEIVVAAGPTFPVTLSLVNGEWQAKDNGGFDASQVVTVSHPAVMRFDPAASLSITTSTTCTVRWRNRWA